MKWKYSYKKDRMKRSFSICYISTTNTFVTDIFNIILKHEIGVKHHRTRLRNLLFNIILKPLFYDIG